MTDIAVLAEGAVQTASANPDAQDPAIRCANLVFKMLHGFYGNLFLSRYATGVLDQNDNDKGVTSARRVWGHNLRGFHVEVVEQAVERSKEKHVDFPPTLPQFLALCRACEPRKTYAAPDNAIEMSPELQRQRAAKAREVHARHDAKAAQRKPLRREHSPGLAGLIEAMADAVACAGGDEVAELARLGRLFSPSNTTVSSI